MIDYIEHENIDDDKVVFYDGFLYIISEISLEAFYGESSYSIDVICLCPEYDAPMSLVDIKEKYPNVHKVIYEDWREGYVFNYGNHRDENKNRIWERVGTTNGYA